MFPLAFVAGWLQGHWWGFISRNYVVWPTFLLMNVFIALKGSHFWFLLVYAVCKRGVAPLCLGCPATLKPLSFIYNRSAYTCTWKRLIECLSLLTGRQGTLFHKFCVWFWGRLDKKCDCHGNQKLTLTWAGLKSHMRSKFDYLDYLLWSDLPWLLKRPYLTFCACWTQVSDLWATCLNLAA